MQVRGLAGLMVALVVAGCDAAPERLTGASEVAPAQSTLAPLVVSISGPTDIYTEGYYRWDAVATGGCDPSLRTYKWYGGANLTTLLSSSSWIAWWIDPTWESRWMRLVVEEPGHDPVTTYVQVTNHLYTGDGGGNDS